MRAPTVISRRILVYINLPEGPITSEWAGAKPTGWPGNGQTPPPMSSGSASVMKLEDLSWARGSAGEAGCEGCR
jgi:hypothetical protein